MPSPFSQFAFSGPDALPAHSRVRSARLVGSRWPEKPLLPTGKEEACGGLDVEVNASATVISMSVRSPIQTGLQSTDFPGRPFGVSGLEDGLALLRCSSPDLNKELAMDKYPRAENALCVSVLPF